MQREVVASDFVDDVADLIVLVAFVFNFGLDF